MDPYFDDVDIRMHDDDVYDDMDTWQMRDDYYVDDPDAIQDEDDQYDVTDAGYLDIDWLYQELRDFNFDDEEM